jgi:hypothetical protein
MITDRALHIIWYRNVGLGAGVFCARVGNIVAPQILLLVRNFKLLIYINWHQCIGWFKSIPWDL